MRVRAELRAGVEGKAQEAWHTVRIDRKAVLWASGKLDDLPVIQVFYES